MTVEKLHGLDLFSGIGGLSLALSEWVDTVAYCERDRYAQGILLSRMSCGDLDWAPIWDDVTTLRGEMLPHIDIIYGGFPCQDISVAGTGKGLEGKRSGLFFEIVRLAEEIKPKFLFLENVPAIRTRGLDRVIQELTEGGYDLRWTMLSAADIGANHKRERWFLLAHTRSTDSGRGSAVGNASSEKRWGSESERAGVQSEDGQARSDDAKPSRENVAHANSPLDEARERVSSERWPAERLDGSSWWEVEPNVGRVVDGIPRRVDRLRALGNAVVPEQAKKAFEILIGVTQ